MTTEKENSYFRPVILIVEDHDALRDSLKSWLGSVLQDCSIRLASTGEEAVAAASSSAPDIVLMDVLLPGMSGISASRRIKDVAPGAQVVMLSIYEDPAYQTDSSAAGACAYIPKRKMGTELIPLITKLLRDRHDQPIRSAGRRKA